ARRRRHGIRRGVLRALQAAADRAAHRARRSAGPEGAPDRALVPRLLRDRDALRARARLSRAEDHRLPDQLRLRSPFHRRVRPPAHHRARDRERDRIRLAQEPAPGILEQVGESMKFIAAAIQMLASEDKEANLAHAEKAVLEAAARGARLAALPEVFNWRGDKADEKKNAEPLGGPTAERMARLAPELKSYLPAGPLLEEIPEARKCYTTSLLFGPDGRQLARYRKIHLFDVAIARGVTALESDTREHGAEVVTAETEFGRVGLSVCYDLRFPELYRGLVDQGAKIIFIPAAFTAFTGEAHWEPLLRARAIENQVYL